MSPDDRSPLGPAAGLKSAVLRLVASVREAAARTDEGDFCRQRPPAVLFRVPPKGSGGAGRAAAGLELIHWSDVLCKLMHTSAETLNVGDAIFEVVNCARYYLRDACAVLQLAEKEGGSGGAEMCSCLVPSKDNDEGGAQKFSGDTLVWKCAEHMQCREGSNSLDHVVLSRSLATSVSSDKEDLNAHGGDLCCGTAAACNDVPVVGGIQEAHMMLQVIMGTAFSCPSERVAKAFQLVIAEELERSSFLSEACCGIVRFFSPLAAPPPTAEDEATRRAWDNSCLYVLHGIPHISGLSEALLLLSAAGPNEGEWCAAPSLAAALPTLTRLLSAELPEVLEELQDGDCSGDKTQPPATAKSGSLTATSEKTPDNASRSALWDALCRCGFTFSRPVCADRRAVLHEIFLKTGEVPQYYNLLSVCPDLLQAHHVTFQYLFFGEGPLSICERLMIALMAASRQKCGYLVSRYGALLMHFAEEQQSGDSTAKNWLLQGPPPALKVLQRFIGIATHVPWKLEVNDIRHIINAGWSISAFFQASCIVAETLSLCSFVMGLFVPNDLWTLVTLPASLKDSVATHPAPGQVQQHHGEMDFTRYTGVDDIVSENRIKRSSGGTRTLSFGTFNWHEHGAVVLEQYYPGAAALINNELDAFSALLRKVKQPDCVGLTTPEYSPSYAFLVLGLYVQNIIGFTSEGYPHNSINKVLRRQAKSIAHSCTMRPETMSCSQVRLWAQTSDGSQADLNDVPVSQQSATDTAPKETSLSRCTKEHREQLVESVASQQAAFALSMPGCGPARRQEPAEEVLETALRLHEERLIFLVVLATTQARKEGLLSLLLHPISLLLSDM